MTKQEFIDKAWEEAIKARENGASISVPIAVAQAALETGYGNSGLSSNHNNLFGIKGEYKGQYALYPTREQLDDGTWVTIQAKFRAYSSWSDCFEDYGSIIRRLSWYQDAEDAAHSPRDFLKGLMTLRADSGEVIEPGWATDHAYFEKVWSIVESHNLLHRDEVKEPESFHLIQIFDGTRRYDFNPLKVTPGTTNDGQHKLMVRVEETTFWQRLKFLFLRG